jgi:hypothetical protein
MSHINTLEVYREYKLAGFSDEQAEKMTSILENSFMTKVRELKSEFTSNKMITTLGIIIITIGSFTLAKVWDLSHDMVEVKSRLTFLEQRIK